MVSSLIIKNGAEEERNASPPDLFPRGIKSQQSSITIYERVTMKTLKEVNLGDIS